MNRNMKLLVTLVIIVVASIVLWKSTSRTVNEMKAEQAEQVSDDSLSMGIHERWGGGLPAGYEAQVADDLEAGGYLFARLTYQEPVEDLLEKWENADEEILADFKALVDAQLALPELPEEHRTLLESVEPWPDETWLAYTASGKDGGQIILLYGPETMTMYVAEAAE